MPISRFDSRQGMKRRASSRSRNGARGSLDLPCLRDAYDPARGPLARSPIAAGEERCVVARAAAAGASPHRRNARLHQRRGPSVPEVAAHPPSHRLDERSRRESAAPVASSGCDAGRAGVARRDSALERCGGAARRCLHRCGSAFGAPRGGSPAGLLLPRQSRAPGAAAGSPPACEPRPRFGRSDPPPIGHRCLFGRVRAEGFPRPCSSGDFDCPHHPAQLKSKGETP